MDDKEIKAFKTKAMVQRNLYKENLKVKSLDNLIPKLKKGEVYNIVTQKILNPYTFILSAIKKGDIDHLYIVTYAINLKSFAILTNLLDSGVIKKWTLIINKNAHFRMKGKEQVLFDSAEKRDNFNVILLRNHAKITLIDQKKHKIVISGSGNYSENRKIEQYTICDDPDLFEFHRSWIDGES